MLNRFSLLALGLAPLLGGAPPQGGPTADAGLTASLATAPGMRGLVFGIFDERSGQRIGRLRVDRADVEYGRQGFLHVAWRPLVVLSGVFLEAGEISDWGPAGAQIIDALKVAGRRESFVMRDLRLQLRLADGTRQEIAAGEAALRADGAIELRGAKLKAGSESGAVESGALCLWLAGPEAGRLTEGPATNAAQKVRRILPETSDPIAR